MTERGKDSWRGGRRSSREAVQEAAAAPVWKRSKRVRKSSRGGPPWRRILLPIIGLSFLVWLGIRIFWPDPRVHTHFVVLDFLFDTQRNDATSDHFDSVAPPNFPVLPPDRFPVARTTIVHADTLRFAEAESLEDRERDRVVVVYLQTQILPGENGSFLCLVKNSTPDLNAPARYEELATLKEQVRGLLKDRAADRVLLLVDRPASLQDRRLGDLHADFMTEVLSWPAEDDLNQLVVITSCQADQQSAPGLSGANGQTAFGQIVTRGFSKAADANDDGELTATEFCRFTVEETQRWVQRHVDPDGQTVQISPALDSLKDSPHDFVLMKELPPAPETTRLRDRRQTVQRLSTLWERREAADQLLGWRWRPLLWQSSTEYLTRAQAALISGNETAAENLAQRAETRLRLLETAIRTVIPDPTELNAERGLPRPWFLDLPEPERLNDVWETAEAVSGGPDVPAEDVLRQNLATYPFQQLGLATSDQRHAAAIERRKQAEDAIARAFGVSIVLRQTITNADAALLQAEDQLFVRSDSTAVPEAATSTSNSIWTAIRDFESAHQTADVAVQRTLASADSLSRWAAEYPIERPDTFFSGWQALLRKNLPGGQLTPEQGTDLRRAATELSLDPGPGANGTAVRLRAEIFRLLVAARVLAGQLYPQEPAAGFSEQELKDRAAMLVDWHQQTRDSREAVQTLLQELSAGISILPGKRIEQVQNHQQLRTLLNVSCLETETRQKLMASLIRLEEKLSEATDEEITASGMKSPDLVERCLWHIQSLNPFVDAATKGETAAELTSAIQLLLSGNSSRHETLSRYGKIVRSFWSGVRREGREAVISAAEGTIHRLREADICCRGLTAYDALPRSPTVRFHALLQADYCLLQAQRRLQEQWVRPDEQAPWETNGWYARQAKRWLQLARARGGAAEPSPDILPTFLKNAVDQEEDRLTKSAAWSVTGTPESAGAVDLSDQNEPLRSVPVSVRREGTMPVGTAAIRQLPISDIPVSQLVSFQNNAQPLTLNDAADRFVAKAFRTGSPATGECEPVTIATSIFFRGRSWDSERQLRVDPCAGDEFVVTRIARPETASIELKGDDRRPIVFILDMSDSMKATLGDGTRVDEAVDTLQTVISDAQFGQTTRAALKIFGHRMKYGPDFEPVGNSKYEEIFKKQIPAGLKPNDDVATEFEMSTLSDAGKRRLNGVLEMARSSRHWGQTPLAFALWEALTTDLKDQPGIIVAITDGLATDVGRDPQTGKPLPAEVIRKTPSADRTPQLKGALKRNPSTRIIIVAFDFAAAGAARLALDEVFVRDCGIPREDVVDAADRSQLKEQILKGLKNRPFTVTGHFGESRQSEEFGRIISGLKPADDYVISFANISTQKPVAIGPGDAMSLQVDWLERRFEFRREPVIRLWQNVSRPPLSTEWDAPVKLRAYDEAVYTRYPDDVAGAENYRQVDLRLMLDHDDIYRPVRQPAEVEFDIRDGESRPSAFTETFTSEWGAPGYRLQIERWPSSRHVRVDAFWKMNRTAPEQVLDYPQIHEARRVPQGGIDLLPGVLLSGSLQSNGQLKIRLDAADGTPQDAANLVEDIRVEVGRTDVREQNRGFVPDEVRTTVRRTEKGSVIYEFDGAYNAENLQTRQIALTSRAARLKQSFRLETPLEVSRFRNQSADER
ncbi:MAG: hypothetical protein RIK87_22810 [Fuerstiella sp.]